MSNTVSLLQYLLFYEENILIKYILGLVLNLVSISCFIVMLRVALSLISLQWLLKCVMAFNFGCTN